MPSFDVLADEVDGASGQRRAGAEGRKFSSAQTSAPAFPSWNAMLRPSGDTLKPLCDPLDCALRPDTRVDVKLARPITRDGNPPEFLAAGTKS